MTPDRDALIAWVKEKQTACEAAYRNLTYRNGPHDKLSPGAVQFRSEADHFAALHALLLADGEFQEYIADQDLPGDEA